MIEILPTASCRAAESFDALELWRMVFSTRKELETVSSGNMHSGLGLAGPSCQNPCHRDSPGTSRHIQAPNPHSDTKSQRRYWSTCLRLYDTAQNNSNTLHHSATRCYKMLQNGTRLKASRVSRVSNSDLCSSHCTMFK